jgi:hypothetical protein
MRKPVTSWAEPVDDFLMHIAYIVVTPIYLVMCLIDHLRGFQPKLDKETFRNRSISGDGSFHFDDELPF